LYITFIFDINDERDYFDWKREQKEKTFRIISFVKLKKAVTIIELMFQNTHWLMIKIQEQQSIGSQLIISLYSLAIRVNGTDVLDSNKSELVS